MSLPHAHQCIVSAYNFQYMQKITSILYTVFLPEHASSFFFIIMNLVCIVLDITLYPDRCHIDLSLAYKVIDQMH